jgi:hypothetical protein
MGIVIRFIATNARIEIQSDLRNLRGFNQRYLREMHLILL